MKNHGMWSFNEDNRGGAKSKNVWLFDFAPLQTMFDFCSTGMVLAVLVSQKPFLETCEGQN